MNEKRDVGFNPLQMGYATNLIFSSLLILIPVFNASPTVIYQSEVATTTPPVVRTMPVVKTPVPSASQLALINKKAEEYNVSAEVMKKVISCESGYNPNALGDFGYSRGLVQIHSKYHPDVTDDMAYNEEFAIDFLAQKLSEGRGSLWSCYNMFYSGVDT